MTSKRKTKYIQEGRYVAEVQVNVIEVETSWSPYLTVEDAKRLDQVRAALRVGDLKVAAGIGRDYTLEPIAAAQ